MTKFEELQAMHERLMEQSKAPADTPAFVEEVQHDIQEMCVAAEDIPAPRERDQLRAILRFWASYVYDHTGTYPDTTLRPAQTSPTPAAPSPSASEQGRPPLFWIVLAAGAALIVLLVAVSFITRPPVTVPPAIKTPHDSVIIEVTIERPLAPQIQIQYTILTAGPSPFDDDAWVVKLQLSATGGNGIYVFWVNNEVLPDVGNNQFTVEGEGCDPKKPVVGVTSDGKATSLELVIQSPLKDCQQP